MTYKIKLEDLPQHEEMFYVGDIVDVDGSGWVEEREALEIIESLNSGPDPILEDWDDFSLNEEF